MIYFAFALIGYLLLFLFDSFLQVALMLFFLPYYFFKNRRK